MKPPDAPRILVVEDHLAVQRVVRNLFESAGWTVDTAEDGVQGIESFHLNPPDLVVLDLGLPRLDGHGVCRHLSRLRPTCRSSL